MKSVLDIARKMVHYCEEDTAVSHVAHIMQKYNVDDVLVRRNEKIVGIITVGDILRNVSKQKIPKKASDIMSSPVITFPSDISIKELAQAFRERALTRSVLMKNNKVVGILRDKDVYKYLRFTQLDNYAKEVFESRYFHNVY